MLHVMSNSLHQLGKRAKKIDPRTLMLAKYLPAKLEAPPTSMGYIDLVPSWPMMGNDVLGDCTAAAAGHMEQQWSAYANPPGFVPSDEDVVKLYSATGGYIVGEPQTDNGAMMIDVLNYLRSTGLAGKKILAYAEINMAGDAWMEEIKQSVDLFGNAYIGVQLPVTVQGQGLWNVPKMGPIGNGSPGSWGGHCVPIVGYGPTGVKVISWGMVIEVTWNFLKAYCDEAYAVLSLLWISQVYDKAPSRFNIQQLQADLPSL